jgi:hypothetical protein
MYQLVLAELIEDFYWEVITGMSSVLRFGRTVLIIVVEF